MGVLSSKDGSASIPDGSANVDMQYSSNLHQDLYRRSLDGYDTVNANQNDLILSFNDGDPNHNLSNNNSEMSNTNRNGGNAADELVSVFRWEHGGNTVFISGTFNGWKENIPMHRSGNDFSYICTLPRGKYIYKFLVDGEWRFSPDQPTLADAQGNVNNMLDLTLFRSTLDETKDFRSHIVPDEELGQDIPPPEQYDQEPPYLPAQLRHIILNHTAPEVHGVHLPIPQHVTLNHLYCTAIKDRLIVLGVTNRYREKFVTTITYGLQDNTFDEVATQHRNLMKQNAEIKKQYNEHRNGTHHNQLSQSLS
jgi:hypothetical protein